MSSNVRFWRYSLPSIAHEGWAIIVIGSDGFFAAVSDYGNYAYLWTHPGLQSGQDMRSFFLKLNWQYFMTKLYGSPDKYNPTATLKEVKLAIIEGRRHSGWSPHKARREWDALESNSYLESEYDFESWVGHASMDEAYEFRVNGWPADAQAFGEKILPRLQQAIREELAQETSKVDNP